MEGLTLPGLPTGPGVAYSGILEAIYGLGFTVGVAVFDRGGIGHIGTDSNPRNPNGSWTVNQRAVARGVIDGQKLDITSEHDIDLGAPHYLAPNNIIYYDHPGVAARKGNFANFNFAITATNGKEKCQLKFWINVSYGGRDNSSVTWGGTR